MVASALGLATLTACTGDGGGGGGSNSGTSAGGGASPAPSDSGGADAASTAQFPEAAATAAMPWGQGELSIGVRSIVRYKERLVLTLDLHLEGPDEDIPKNLAESTASAWRSNNVPDGLGHEMRGVRLVDLDGGMIASPAVDVEREIAMILTEPADDGTDAARRGTIQVGYGDTGTDTVALFLPGAGLLSGLTIDSTDIPSVENTDHPLDLLTIDEAPVTPMITRAFDLLAPLREENDGETSTVSIGSDVLFDSSSAELTGDAAQILDVATTRLMAHEPGEVTVEGHTDAVGEDQANQELSVARAEAVAASLAERIDTAQFPLVADGKGESEPVVETDSENGNAENRRVQMMISTPLRDEAGGEATRAPFDGLSATGEEGLELESFDGRPYLLRVPRARIVAGHLVATLEATIEDDAMDDGGLGGQSKVPGGVLDSYHDEFELLFSNGGLGVLTGSLLTLPVLHRLVEDEATLLHPLTSLYTNHRIDGGVTVIDEIVYPRGLTGVEAGGTIALQMGTDGIRLTDIPVTG